MMSKTWQRLMKNKKKTEEEKKIVDEAMEKAVTPEIQLAIHRATKDDPNIWRVMMRYISFIGVIGLAIILISMNYTLEAHFGEDNWDDMRDAIPEEEQESLDKFSFVMQILVIVVIIDVLFMIWGTVRDIRYESKMKKLIIEKEMKK